MFFAQFAELKLHSTCCKLRHPPGDEIYRDDNQSISVFEVDGYFERVYCENLCFISKCFLDHKRFDKFEVGNFYFYIVGEWGLSGLNIVGYFSKEKQQTQRNLSCIMLLPCYQRKGYGKFLIEFSYELGRIVGKVGTPERPLSDLGKRTYLSFWLGRIVRFIDVAGVEKAPGGLSISDISTATSILGDDVKMTLEDAGMIKYKNGQHVMIYTPSKLKQLVAEGKLKTENKDYVKFDAELVHWVPLNLPEPGSSAV
jgi:histone acetyltransferase MYST1